MWANNRYASRLGIQHWKEIASARCMHLQVRRPVNFARFAAIWAFNDAWRFPGDVPFTCYAEPPTADFALDRLLHGEMIHQHCAGDYPLASLLQFWFTFHDSFVQFAKAFKIVEPLFQGRLLRVDTRTVLSSQSAASPPKK